MLISKSSPGLLASALAPIWLLAGSPTTVTRSAASVEAKLVGLLLSPTSSAVAETPAGRTSSESRTVSEPPKIARSGRGTPRERSREACTTAPGASAATPTDDEPPEPSMVVWEIVIVPVLAWTRPVSALPTTIRAPVTAVLPDDLSPNTLLPVATSSTSPTVPPLSRTRA